MRVTLHNADELRCNALGFPEMLSIPSVEQSDSIEVFSTLFQNNCQQTFTEKLVCSQIVLFFFRMGCICLEYKFYLFIWLSGM